MKLAGSASILMLLSSLLPVSASESRDAIQRAIADLKNASFVDKDLELNSTISALSKLINDTDQTTALEAFHLKNHLNDSNLESLTIMSAPICFILVIVCLYAAATQSSPKGIDKSANLRALKLASIDFSISDEDFLKIRKNLLG